MHLFRIAVTDLTGARASNARGVAAADIFCTKKKTLTWYSVRNQEAIDHERNLIKNTVPWRVLNEVVGLYGVQKH